MSTEEDGAERASKVESTHPNTGTAALAAGADEGKVGEHEAEAPAQVAELGKALTAVTEDGVATSDTEEGTTSGHQSPDTLAQKIQDTESKLPPPETGKWREEWPKSVVKKMQAGAFNPKRPELGGIDLTSIMTGTENEGKLKSRLATTLEPSRDMPGILGEFLADKVSVLIGGPNSKANDLAIAIAKAVAQGGTVLGAKAESATVLYIDPVRPEAAIADALGADRPDLGNLLILAAGTTDADILNEITNLKALDVALGLVVINEFGRIATELKLSELMKGDGETRFLLVLSEPKFKLKVKYRWEKSTAIDMTVNKHVMYLQPCLDDAVRLTVVKYGEVVKDVAVDPNDNWKPLGTPEAGVRGKRQAAVLATVTEASEKGVEPKEVAALLGMTPNNVYQALLLLGRGEMPKIFKENGRYYLVGVEPKSDPKSEQA